MTDWLDNLRARGLLTDAQVSGLRALRASAPRPPPSRPLSNEAAATRGFSGPISLDAGLVACVACGAAWTGAGATVCPTCGAQLRRLRHAGPILTAPKSNVRKSSAPGKSFGRYVLRREIGRGGMGIVYEAMDTSLHRTVALKMLLAAKDELDHEAVERFRREASAAARLRHPAILAVHDIGVHEGRHYMTMPLLDGSSLHDRIWEDDAATAFPLEARLAVLGRVASALAAAHEAGVVHRDVKPSNILIDREGRGYLTDFGLARDMQSALASLTVTGAMVGTLEFMSPEQARPAGPPAGPAADVFSFGVVAYFSLTGEMPGGDRSIPALSVLDGLPIAAPRELNPDIPAPVEDLILRCLRREPGDRPANGAELVRRLATRGAPGTGPAEPQAGRRLPRVVVPAAVAAAALLVGFLAGRSGRKAPPPAPPQAAGTVSAPTEETAPPPPPSDRSRVLLDRAEVFLRQARSAPTREERHRSAGTAYRLVEEVHSHSRPTRDSLLRYGESLALQDREDEAESAWRDALRLNEGDPEVALLLAWLVFMRECDEALALGTDALPPRPTRVLELTAAALRAAPGLSSDHPAWAGALDALARREPGTAAPRLNLPGGDATDSRAPWLRGVAASGAEAVDAFSTAVRRRPGSPRLLSCLASALARADRGALAAQTAEQVLALAPDHVPALQTQAVLRLKTGVDEPRQETFDRILAINPEFLPARHQRGLVLMALGRHDLAIEDFTRVLKVLPKCAIVLIRRGEGQLARMNLGSALDDLNAALAIEPDREEGLRARAVTLTWLRQNEGALADLERLLARDPTQERTHLDRIRLLRALDRKALAALAAEEGAKALPHSVEILLERADLNQAGPLEQVLRDLDEIDRLKPDDPRAVDLRLAVLLRHGKSDEVYKLADRILAKDPDHAHALYWRSTSQLLTRNYADALTGFERVIQLAPANSWLSSSAAQRVAEIRRKFLK